MSTEEFVACLIMRGFAVADFDKFTYGMLINYCNAHDRLQRIARGESVPDEEMQYKQLKSIEPIVEDQFKKGEISQEKYDDYKKSLFEWERG